MSDIVLYPGAEDPYDIILRPAGALDVERTGGGISGASAGGAATLVVHFPTPEEEEPPIIGRGGLGLQPRIRRFHIDKVGGATLPLRAGGTATIDLPPLWDEAEEEAVILHLLAHDLI